MNNYFISFFDAALANNFVLVKFLGLCPFMGVSRRLETAIGMAMATTFVLTLASLCSYLLEHYILVPLGLLCLQVMIFILIIAIIVQSTEIFVKKISPTLYHLMGIYLPLITSNCAVLGVALINVNRNQNLIGSVIYGFSSAVGFSLVIILFSAIRERLALADVPEPFRGASVAMVTAGMMSLAFLGFNGLTKL